ncbi:MAG TPA: GtrA family protein [Marmoricola sp.]|nr:GtrA family protein [Marmoricola sp.]
MNAFAAAPTYDEVLTFLVVGGAGYVVDVAAFNGLRSMAPLSRWDPTVARTLAVLVAMCVTYLGNRFWTWRNAGGGSRREVALFVGFNVIAFGFSVATLALSHDVLGLTSRLADNISANVVGMALGTAFRFVTYRRWVFAGVASEPVSSAAHAASGRSRSATPRPRPPRAAGTPIAPSSRPAPRGSPSRPG